MAEVISIGLLVGIFTTLLFIMNAVDNGVRFLSQIGVIVERMEKDKRSKA